MKNLITLTLVLGLTATLCSANENQPRSEIKRPDAVFAPQNFDNNDNAQLVTSGTLTSYCTKIGATQFEIDKPDRKIYITQTISSSENCNNLEMYIPYSVVINLGTLPVGKYEVFTKNSDNKFIKATELPILPAVACTSAGTDERIYAPVNSIEFKVGSKANEAIVTLKGIQTNSCLGLAQVEFYQSKDNVIEVLPLLKMRNKNCKASSKAFTKLIHIKDFPSGTTLIHVRTMNGQSLNKVVTNLDRLN